MRMQLPQAVPSLDYVTTDDGRTYRLNVDVQRINNDTSAIEAILETQLHQSLCTVGIIHDANPMVELLSVNMDDTNENEQGGDGQFVVKIGNHYVVGHYTFIIDTLRFADQPDYGVGMYTMDSFQMLYVAKKVWDDKTFNYTYQQVHDVDDYDGIKSSEDDGI